MPELVELWRVLDARDSVSALAVVGRGLQYKGRGLAEGAWTIRAKPRPNDLRGFAELPADLPIYGLPLEVGMNLDKAVVRRPVSGTTTGIPQVLLNYAPVSRGPWRIKAIIDAPGHAVTSRFITVRPNDPSLPVEFLWALLNSPMANAYVYCHSMKRDNLVGTVRKIPIPNVSAAGIERVVSAARAYLATVKEPEPFMRPEQDETLVKDALLRMDAEVLRLYDLPPRLERQLLDLFAGEERKGVGCKFTGYFPAGFKPFVPLHEYISDDYRRSTVGEMRKRYRPVRSKAVLDALDRALEAFTDE